MRRPLAILVMASIAVIVLSATSIAIPTAPVNTITLRRGTTTSTDPNTEVGSSDDSYYTVTATLAHGTFGAAYIATFVLPITPPDGAVFLNWEGQGNAACNLKMALYNWKTKHFVVGASGYITNTDDTFTQRGYPAKLFVRNLKVRSRISCSNPDAFDLLTDSLYLQY